LARKKSRIGWWILAGLVLLLAVFHNIVVAALGEYLVRADSPEKTDIAVVLAGDPSGNRIVKAAELARAGDAPRILVSGPAAIYGYYECDLAIPFAEKLGFPASYFVAVPNHSHSTRDEAEAMLAEVRRAGAHTVLLVTSNFHTRRAGRIYRKAAPDLRFVVIAAPDPDFTPEAWWKNREGRKTFAIEWMKTIAEWVGL
jgi:uncharacterized SAM-binding protein YcdF (DUF218 family)